MANACAHLDALHAVLDASAWFRNAVFGAVILELQQTHRYQSRPLHFAMSNVEVPLTASSMQCAQMSVVASYNASSELH